MTWDPLESHVDRMPAMQPMKPDTHMAARIRGAGVNAPVFNQLKQAESAMATKDVKTAILR